MGNAEVSVVIPVFNEELNVIPTYSQTDTALKKLKKSYEIIFVDDGSTDSTFANLRKVHDKDSSVTVIRLRRNSGKTLALNAGFSAASGNFIVTLDGDLQNDAEDIPLLLDKLREGYDVASGWRHRRKDAFVAKRLPSLFSNWLARKITGVNLHDFGCPLKAYRRETLEHVQLYGDIHRYLPALVAPQGFRVAEVRVRHYSRRFGRSKYGIGRLLRGPLDLLYLKFRASYATRPLHFFGMIGILCFMFGAIIGAADVAYWLFVQNITSVGPVLLMAIVLAVVGIQFITLGFITEIIVSTHYSISEEKPYLVEKVLKGRK